MFSAYLDTLFYKYSMIRVLIFAYAYVCACIHACVYAYAAYFVQSTTLPEIRILLIRYCLHVNIYIYIFIHEHIHVYCALYNVQYALYNIQMYMYAMNISRRPIYSYIETINPKALIWRVFFSLHSTDSVPHTRHASLQSVYYTMYIVHCIVYIVHCIVHNAHCTM